MDKDFKYTTAEDSRKPGYLKAKFDRIRRELREKETAATEAAEAAALEAERKVRRISK